MSNYFSGLQFDKITSTLSSAAYKTQRKLNETQEQFTQAINNIDEKYAILSLKTQKHKLQEALGTVKDISNLPPQYQHLEKKCDTFEKVCKRILMVTVTFEVEGYDYPPNITETLSDWWGSRKDTPFLKFTTSKADKSKDTPTDNKSASTKPAPPSFAQAVGKAAGDSAKLVKGLLDEYETISEATDEEEGDDEDAEAILKMLNAWSEAQYNMDAAKQEMDQFMVKEFNKKLSDLLNSEFKKAHALRKNVENSRLKFDTLRHEHAISKQAAAKEDTTDKITGTEESSATEAQEEASTTAQKENDELHALLEKAEDEFVSCTLDAVTFMTQLTNSAKMITLVKLYHNFQLLYHKQCVQEIQKSLNTLNALALEEDE